MGAKFRFLCDVSKLFFCGRPKALIGLVFTCPLASFTSVEMKGLVKALGFEPSSLQYCFTHIFLQEVLGLFYPGEGRPLGRVGGGVMNRRGLIHLLGLGVVAALFLSSCPSLP